MGRKARSQTKAITKSLGSSADQETLQHYFNQMIGSEKADPIIVLPKYKKLMELLEQFHNLLLDLQSVILDSDDCYQDATRQISEYTNCIKDLLDSKVDDKDFESAQYNIIKDHDVIQTMIVTCSNLSDIHVHLKKKWEDVDKKFFMRYQPLKFTPFPFAKSLDLKKIWIVDGANKPAIVEYVFTFMSAIFKNVHEVYKTVTSPDVDVAQLSAMIIKALGSLKKQLPRCDKAFKTIEQSVSLLEGNFDSYYKDFVQSKDPTNIFTGFIGDVADTCDSDPQLIFQCRKIVNFYKKSVQKRTSNGEAPTAKTKMFEALMKNYNILEKKVIGSTKEEEYEDDENKENETPESGVSEEKETPAELPDLDDLMKHINDTNNTSV